MRFERSVNGGAFTTRGHGRLVAGLHRLRRHDQPGRRRPGGLPGRPDLLAGEHRHERDAHGDDRADPGRDGDDPLQRHPTDWGLHLFGDGLAPGEATAAWANPTPFEGTDGFGVFHEIGIADDTKRVGFIVHRRPPGDPNTKDPEGSPDRFFIPLATPEIWLRQGDSRIYSCEAADSSCIVPSAHRKEADFPQRAS